MTSQPQYKYDAFLCHNSKDKPEVSQIEKQLKAKGIRTFLDVSEILGGDSWSNKIVDAISESKTVVVFFGKHGLGPYQKKEIMEFRGEPFRRGLKVIPVMLKDSPAPENLNLPKECKWITDKFHYVDLRSGKDPQLTELIKAIGITNISPNITPPEDPLPSEKGVDYTPLRDLLKAGNWKEADKETLAVMLKCAGREKEGWLDSNSIEKFPCTDLRTIDQLWVKYSNGHFGFSVQKQIWESVNGNEVKYSKTVGYIRGEKGFGLTYLLGAGYLTYDELTFDDTHAPKGHLPSWWWISNAVGGLWGVVGFVVRECEWEGMWGYVFSRVQTCKM